VEWKVSIIVPIYKKAEIINCSNYRGTSLLSTTYKSLSNILLSRLTPYTQEINGYHQCGFRRGRSTTDHTLCIRQILEKNWEYNEAAYQLFIDFRTAYDSFRREVCLLFSWRYNPFGCIFTAPYRALASSFSRFLDHTRHITVGKNPLDQ